jgi:hypothetical protein
MKKIVFFCALMLVLGLNLTSCTPQPLTQNGNYQATGGEEENDPVDPDYPDGDD